MADCPSLHNLTHPLCLISLTVPWPVQKSYSKNSYCWKFLLELIMFSTLPSSLKKNKKIKKIEFIHFKSFQQLIKPGDPSHHFAPSSKNMHSLRLELSSVCSSQQQSMCARAEPPPQLITGMDPPERDLQHFTCRHWRKLYSFPTSHIHFQDLLLLFRGNLFSQGEIFNNKVNSQWGTSQSILSS